MLGALPVKLRVMGVGDGERTQNRRGPTQSGGVLALKTRVQKIVGRGCADLQDITVTSTLGGGTQACLNTCAQRATQRHGVACPAHTANLIPGPIVSCTH